MSNPAPPDDIPPAANFSAETDSQAPPAQSAANQPIEADPEVCWAHPLPVDRRS